MSPEASGRHRSTEQRDTDSHPSNPSDTGRHRRSRPLDRKVDRRRRLTVMRRWATGTLAAVSDRMVAVAGCAADGGLGRATSRAALEASMVGALADWFAVTALFRHPLGTADPAHRDRRRTQGAVRSDARPTFFRENFLSGATVADRIRTSAAVARASTWLADPEHATTFVRNVLAAQRERPRRERRAGGRRDRRRDPSRHDGGAPDRGVGDDRARGGREPSARRRHRGGLHRGTTRHPPARRRPRGDLHRGASLVAPRGRPTPGLRAPGRPDRRCARRHCSRPRASGSGTAARVAGRAGGPPRARPTRSAPGSGISSVPSHSTPGSTRW